MKLRNKVCSALAFAALTIAPAGAQLSGQLGILDLEANGGVNPATGEPWQAGDKYRLVFTTSGTTQATSTDITTYNAFVQSAADASSLNIGAAQGVTWKIIGSTAADHARDNTSTNIAVNGMGEAIFLLDGTTVVFTDYVDMWSTHPTPVVINKTELLTTPVYIDWGSVWSGIYRNAYPGDANYGTASAGDELGAADGTARGGLWGLGTGTQWIWRFPFATTYELPVFALSDPLKVSGPPSDTFPLVITPNDPTSLFKLDWPSRAGMLYRVLNNTGLGTPIDTWTLVEGDIAATPPSNSYNVNPGDPRLFYAVEEYPPPPLLEENFDAAALLPVGWTSNGPSNGTDWQVGIPSGVASAPTAANSAPNCASTNIGGYYTENADVSLVSPSIAIPSGSGASLSFRQFIDTDLAGSPHDVGSVRILDADNSDAPIAGLEILDIEGDGLAGWTAETLDLPALDVGGKNIKVEFRFVSNAGAVPDLDVWGGFYVDDVVVTQN